MRTWKLLGLTGAVALTAAVQAPAAPPAQTPAAQAPAAAPAPAAQAGVTAEVVIGKAIENHMATDTGSSFPASVGTLVAWTSVTGAADSKIMHVWAHGPHADTVTLNIGGSPWRTYSRKTIPSDWTGEWKLTVLDATGAVIASKTFTIGG